MIVLEGREGVQPEIAEDHRIAIEADEVAEAELRKHEYRRNRGKSRDRGDGVSQAGGIVKDVSHAVVATAEPERQAARHDEEADKKRQSNTLQLAIARNAAVSRAVPIEA